MAEYIGSLISLISKSDIRYIGTLHEINSETSTVALENVRSMGTEDRRTGEGAQRPSERLYEYIVFRGSDVKDLRIEEPPAPAPQQKRDEWSDPAILGSTRPPQPAAPGQQPPSFNQPPPGYGNNFGPGPFPPPMHPGFGRGGYPPAPGPPGGPGYGYPPFGGPPPPGWGPPPGQGFPGGPGPFSSQPPGGPPGQHLQGQAPPGIPTGPKSGDQKKQAPAEAPSMPEPKGPAAAPAAPKKAPTPPVESKPDVAAATAPPAPTTKAVPPTGPKANRAPIPKKPAAVQQPPQASAAPTQPAQTAPPAAPQSYASATQAATAAVAAAMAKLPMAQKMSQGDGPAIDNLSRKVAEMRTDDRIRHGAQQGTGGSVRGRGRGRGGHHQQTRPMEVPKTDYDFASANAKFNKEDLVKEAIATGSPTATGLGDGEASVNGENADNDKDMGGKTEEVVIPKAEAMYDKKSSFFDNISSEIKDREDGRGREFRAEERRKNLETFGQGSVDGFRGRGRGRGRGFRGARGYGGGGGFGTGRGGFSAARAGGAAGTTPAPAAGAA